MWIYYQTVHYKACAVHEREFRVFKGDRGLPRKSTLLEYLCMSCYLSIKLLYWRYTNPFFHNCSITPPSHCYNSTGETYIASREPNIVSRVSVSPNTLHSCFAIKSPYRYPNTIHRHGNTTLAHHHTDNWNAYILSDHHIYNSVIMPPHYYLKSVLPHNHKATIQA